MQNNLYICTALSIRKIMKKFVLSLSALFATLAINAKEFEIYYVTPAMDTIACENITIPSNLFRSSLYHFDYLGEKIRLVDAEGRKRFKPHDILGFTLTDLESGETFKFISMAGEKRLFYHEVVNGKISLYKTYSNHPYDGSMIIDTHLVKDGVLIPLLGLTGRKAKAATVFEDNPEIAAKWEASKLDYYYLEELVREYNSSFAD